MKILALLAAAISAFSISEQQANEFLRYKTARYFVNSFINFKVGRKEVLLALPAPMAASTSAFKNARKIVSRISTAITDTEPFKVTS